MKPKTPRPDLEKWAVAYRVAIAGRDTMVRELYAAGYNINRIHLLTGIARTSIYRILGKKYRQDHGTRRYTEVDKPPDQGVL